MKRVLVSFAVIAALAACGKKDDKKGDKKGAPSAGAKATDEDCEKIGVKSAAQSMENTPPGSTDEQRAKLKALSDEAGKAITARCKADGWTAEAVVCGLRAQNPAVECDGKLTPEQVQKMRADVMAIFAKATPPPPPGAPPVPTGEQPPTAPPPTLPPPPPPGAPPVP
jgi:hypothetical protein